MTKKGVLSFGNENDHGLRRFLQEIRTFKPLSRKEELALSVRIQAGDGKAVNLLVEANLRFVVEVAKAYQCYGLSLSDLINEGVLGLKKAALKFDGHRGYKFITYAVWFIKQAIQIAIANDQTVKIPINKQITTRKINIATRYLQQLLRREPSHAEIAKYMGIAENLVADCIRQQKHVMYSFENQYYKSIIDILMDHDADLRTKFDETSDTQIFHALLKSLPTKLSFIVTNVYGFADNSKIMTLKDIGEMMNLSAERVRQLKTIALKELIRRGPKFLASHGIYRN